MERLSIIVPALNEAGIIDDALRALGPLRARGHEVIVVDGQSDDGTFERARALADRALLAPRGRAQQMNAGAHTARGSVLLFLHADTHLPPNADHLVLDGLRTRRAEWGCFDVRIEGRHPLLRAIACAMNVRSGLTRIATGDQCIFASRDLFDRVGGYPPIALMEDIALSKILRRHSAPLRIREPVRTSGRRWEARGVGRTIVLMWWLRLRYFLGASPARLAKAYEAHER
jgi:rSAM/selenodomain-associated transferase 2